MFVFVIRIDIIPFLYEQTTVEDCPLVFFVISVRIDKIYKKKSK